MPRRKNITSPSLTAPANSLNASTSPNSTVDNPSCMPYTLEQIGGFMAACLPYIDNHIRSQVEAVSDTKGVSDMAKTHKQRVKIGIDENRMPIYKWATGHSVDELNDSVVRLYVEHGLIDRFLHFDQKHLAAKEDIPTFRAYASKWFETYKKPKLKPTTLNGYKSNLNKHLYPAFGNIRLDEITPDEVQHFLNERVGLAKNTVHTMFVLFSEIMDAAFEDRLIPGNPAKSKRVCIPSTKKTERKALSPAQLKSIIRDIGEKLTDDTERRFMALLLFTGMRRGEILGLRWEDIDFEKKLITVNRAVSYTANQPIVSTPKSESGKRVIPLEDQLVELLKPLKPAGYVIGDDQPVTQMVARRILRSINQRIDLYGATPHVFRHSYISALAEAGVDLKTIQKISGHANVSTTMGIYAHTRSDLVNEAGEKFVGLLAVSKGGKPQKQAVPG